MFLKIAAVLILQYSELWENLCFYLAKTALRLEVPVAALVLIINFYCKLIITK